MATYKKQLKDYQGNNILPVIAERELTQAQYNALSDSQKNDGTTYYITDGNPSGSVESYSTTEVNTGGTWLDGRPIYKRSIDVGALPSPGTKNTDISSWGITKVVKVEGITENRANGNIRPIPYVSASQTGAIRLIVNGRNTIQVETYVNDWSDYTSVIITIWYTKN